MVPCHHEIEVDAKLGTYKKKEKKDLLWTFKMACKWRLLSVTPKLVSFGWSNRKTAYGRVIKDKQIRAVLRTNANASQGIISKKWKNTCQ
jgi:hypothetical protein